jgi:arylsulfatase A-like enzyme
MTEEKSFGGTIGRTISESTPWWPEAARPPAGAPDVVVIVLDDVGFSQLGCYGSPVATPHMDALAAGGTRLSSFHVTPLCSPTRAALLTGANHHSVGMGMVANWDTGYPGYRGRLPANALTMADHLRTGGYNTMAVGKWHLTPPEAMSSVGPYAEWPLGRGFDRFHGFLGAWANQFVPELWTDNHQVPIPDDPNYHLSTDLVDHSIELIRNQVTASLTKPFFLYLAFGACHAPFHAPREYIDRYRGAFDGGWDRYREDVLGRQQQDGLVPAETVLPPSNPGVAPWNEMSDTERRVAARWQEVFAGFLEHTDMEIGRLIGYLQAIGRFDNTLLLLLSDNGASPEGGVSGIVNYHSLLMGRRESMDQTIALIDELGGPTTCGLYPMGWAQAGNTPLRYYKTQTYGGGVRTPLIVHWPAHLEEGGAIRHDFHYVTDIMPTVLEATGVEADPRAQPDQLHGQSAMPTLQGLPDRKRRGHQYFEMMGHRGIWRDGWKAVSLRQPGRPIDDESWSLYHLDEDFAEVQDLASEEPARLQELIDLWWSDAERYGALPLDDRGPERSQGLPQTALRNQREWVFYPEMAVLPDEVSPNTIDRSHVIRAEFSRTSPDEGGVLLSRGTTFGGFTFFVHDNLLHYEENVAGERTELVGSVPLPPGPCTAEFRFTRTGRLQGQGSLVVDGTTVCAGTFEATIPDLISTSGGLRCGADSTFAVSRRYQGPNVFSGEIVRVSVLLGDPATDPQSDSFQFELHRQ